MGLHFHVNAPVGDVFSVPGISHTVPLMYVGVGALIILVPLDCTTLVVLFFLFYYLTIPELASPNCWRVPKSHPPLPFLCLCSLPL